MSRSSVFRIGILAEVFLKKGHEMGLEVAIFAEKSSLGDIFSRGIRIWPRKALKTVIFRLLLSKNRKNHEIDMKRGNARAATGLWGLKALGNVRKRGGTPGKMYEKGGTPPEMYENFAVQGVTPLHWYISKAGVMFAAAANLAAISIYLPAISAQLIRHL